MLQIERQVYVREACINRVAMPHFRCVRKTASEVMCPCGTAASSSLSYIVDA